MISIIFNFIETAHNACVTFSDQSENQCIDPINLAPRTARVIRNFFGKKKVVLTASVIKKLKGQLVHDSNWCFFRNVPVSMQSPTVIFSMNRCIVSPLFRNSFIAQNMTRTLKMVEAIEPARSRSSVFNYFQ